jgi:hypothetical protein
MHKFGPGVSPDRTLGNANSTLWSEIVAKGN